MVLYILSVTTELENQTNFQALGGVDDKEFTYHLKINVILLVIMRYVAYKIPRIRLEIGKIGACPLLAGRLQLISIDSSMISLYWEGQIWFYLDDRLDGFMSWIGIVLDRCNSQLERAERCAFYACEVKPDHNFYCLIPLRFPSLPFYVIDLGDSPMPMCFKQSSSARMSAVGRSARRRDALASANRFLLHQEVGVANLLPKGRFNQDDMGERLPRGLVIADFSKADSFSKYSELIHDVVKIGGLQHQFHTAGLPHPFSSLMASYLPAGVFVSNLGSEITLNELTGKFSDVDPTLPMGCIPNSLLRLYTYTKFIAKIILEEMSLDCSRRLLLVGKRLSKKKRDVYEIGAEGHQSSQHHVSVPNT
ncbi:hypothetical protein Tco_0463067 [Tanacetum coccineum]